MKKSTWLLFGGLLLAVSGLIVLFQEKKKEEEEEGGVLDEGTGVPVLSANVPFQRIVPISPVEEPEPEVSVSGGELPVSGEVTVKGKGTFYFGDDKVSLDGTLVVDLDGNIDVPEKIRAAYPGKTVSEALKSLTPELQKELVLEVLDLDTSVRYDVLVDGELVIAGVTIKVDAHFTSDKVIKV
jgi:hypothetical protein